MWLKHILEAIMVQEKLMDQAKKLVKASNNWTRGSNTKGRSGLIYLRAAAFAELGFGVRV
jgi:hypothetical protein